MSLARPFVPNPCSSETAASSGRPSSPADDHNIINTTTTAAATDTTNDDNNNGTVTNSHTSLREWVSWLTSQSSSPGTSRGGLGGQESSQELPGRHPYKGVFVGCESLDAAETESLCEDLVKAVFTRLGEEE